MQRAIDGNYVALGQHLVQIVYASASNLLFNLGLKRLIIKVQQFLAVEWLESSQHALANTPDSDGTYNLVLKVVFVLSNSGDVPVSTRNLLVSWDKIADKGENGHENMLCHGHNVGASHFSNSDTTVGFVCGIEVNMVRSNAGGDCELELLSLGESFRGQITRMETDSNEQLVIIPLGWCETYGVVMMISESTSS